MRAIVLAAGLGSRFHALSEGKPKTLIKVNGTPMLGHILNALESKVDEVVIVTGYRSEMIREHCRRSHPRMKVRFVHNEDFESTNNMYSLSLAREFLNGDFLLMNADLCFDPGVIDRLRAAKGSCFAVDKGRYLEEAMKITVKEGFITGISKKIPPNEAFGSSIDVYRIAAADAALLVSEMKQIIDVEGNRNQWTEVMLDRLCRDGRLKAAPLEIGTLRWAEIDNVEDLGQAELLFNETLPSLSRKKIFFFDRDGTLTLGSATIPGAKDFVEALRARGVPCAVLTNNSSRTKAQHFRSLSATGLPFKEDEIIVSTEAAAAFIKSSGFRKVFWTANAQVSAELSEKYGLTFDDQSPDCVLLTYDDEMTYEKMVRLTRHLRAGLPYLATHADLVCPTPEGPIPDAGAFIEVMRMTTGRQPDFVFGKPSPALIEPYLKARGLTLADAVIVGDRLYTDIAMAADSDLTSVLVLTGETTRATYENQPIKADIVTPHLGALLGSF